LKRRADEGKRRAHAKPDQQARKPQLQQYELSHLGICPFGQSEEQLGATRKSQQQERQEQHE
jgi:hypothetical protein